MSRKKSRFVKLLLILLAVASIVVLGCLLLPQSRRSSDVRGDAQDRLVGKVLVEISRICLPNEWKVDLHGDGRCVVLRRVEAVKPDEDHCKVEFSGVVSISGGELPFLIEVDFEPIDTRDVYVSRIGDFSVPQDKTLEKELKKVSRLYCNHLQKTLLAK